MSRNGTTLSENRSMKRIVPSTLILLMALTGCRSIPADGEERPILAMIGKFFKDGAKEQNPPPSRFDVTVDRVTKNQNHMLQEGYRDPASEPLW
jgi:hypothetical protein